MRSVRSGPKKYSQRRSRAAWKYLLGAMLPTVCIGAFHVASAEPTDLHVAAHNQPAWAEQLKGQTIVEDAKEGHVERTAMMERQHQRIMEKINEQMVHDAEVQRTGGQYNNINMMHQYGAGNQDILLMSNPSAEPVSIGGGRCPVTAPVRSYDVSAINVEITLNMWLDFYPGYMYVLTENIDKVRAEETKNKEARDVEGYNPGAVMNGLQNQWIQPLVLRGNQGDCVKLTLRNALEGTEEVSLNIHGSSMVMAATGQPASTTNPDSIAGPGKAVDMEWYIPPTQQEGSRQFHSYSNDRELTVMGLFGSFVIEPKGSEYLEPLGTGDPQPTKSGWQAIIKNGTGPDFREFVLFYHEVGDEAFRPLNKKGDFIPQRDPLTDVYRPVARALNYRSEPFGVDNMQTQHEYFGFEDESMAYSAYTFGDPATTIPRSYLGDPAKFRLVHGGSEVFHSHHPHGGSIRWPRSPRAIDEMPLWHTAKNGPVKYPVIRTKSDRVDVEVIGPSETMDLETECGSGLCQQLAGDFLFHCHVAHHYIAGMWGYWRVYNTIQQGANHNDVMPDLLELPDRKGRIKVGVTSDELIGKTVDWFGKQFTIIEKGKTDWKATPALVTVKDWVEMQFPPQGLPGHKKDEREQTKSYDASVLNWGWQGHRAMTEPENTVPNPRYQSAHPNERLPIVFEPTTGKVSWPHLKPHFGRRVPFSKGHNPSPWLEMIHLEEDGLPSSYPAKPGENGRWSLCPENAGSKKYNVHFIHTPMMLADKQGNTPAIMDEGGLIYVLHEEEAAVRKNNDLKFPLVVRSNIYDCVDWMLTSEWDDDDFSNFHASKVNTHWHFLQFDNQSSDGVITGFSNEQSVRPFTMLEKKTDKGLPLPLNTTFTKAAKKGERVITVKNAAQYHPEIEILIGADNVGGNEVGRIKSIKGNEITLVRPLKNDHPVKDIVTVEFVRQRFWVDSDVGTVFWHDHALGRITWGHGGFGTMIVEPVGSTYHNPKTGAPIRSGPLADIRTAEPVGYGVNGSFRELLVQLNDSVPHTINIVTAGNPPGQPVEVALEAGKTISFPIPDHIKMTPMPFLNGGTHTTGGSLNFRAEPISGRMAANPDMSKLFSSAVHGDPYTPMVRAYLGDTVVFRLLQTMTNESMVWTLSGHTYLTERYAGDANRKNSIHVGIAERYDLVVPQAGGPRLQAGDYIHFNGRSSKFSEGAWGILRVLDKDVSDLQKLPAGYSGRNEIPKSLAVCPAEAPVKNFNVVAIDFPSMKLNPKAPDAIEVDFERTIQMVNPDAKIYTLEEDVSAVASGVQPMPLTLRANVGDCLKVKLTNKMKQGRASFSALGLAFDPKDSLGANVGNNPGEQTVAPGESRTYTYYADPFIGETASLVWDWGNVMTNPRNGLYGGIVIGPKGATYRDPKTGADISTKNSWVADVIVDRTIQGYEHRQNYRDVALFFQDEDNIIGTSFMPYVQNTAGLTAVNYRSEPYKFRESNGCTLGKVFQPCSVDKPESIATPLIEAHAGDPVRIHVFGASNEQNGMFSVEKHEWPIEPFMRGADQISVVEFSASETLDAFIPAAGGSFRLPGDYVWSNQRLPYAQSGQWGLMKVLPHDDQRILPLSQQAPSIKRAGLESGDPTVSRTSNPTR
ncbi:MAG: multicopper oxidase domain-containing protein [Nitrospira sp.]|nr:multicopper oxidase domain-containing protein [Nitrospira sp.]MBP6604138.1 multicopper oxidase domain-containing protein [Nitrospira sp.]HQY58195.1 multicopper oxidase domain-containing protein [Nitrospira sp.]